jgi:phytanoyl-CoA hydroxylase
VFKEVSLSREVQDLVREIGFRDPRMLQSMIICKQPEIGGKGTYPHILFSFFLEF